MGKPILIDFFAEWCGPCKRMGPIIEELKGMMGDKVEIKKLDVDQHMAEAQKYQISVVPTIVIEKDGSALWIASPACVASIWSLDTIIDIFIIIIAFYICKNF